MYDTHMPKTQEEQLFHDINIICADSIMDSNKTIYLEKILKICTDNTTVYKYIWLQNGIPLLFLQEIIKPFVHLNKPTFTKEMSHDVTTVIKILGLLIHDDFVKTKFIESNLHIYLFVYISNYGTSSIYEETRQSVLILIKTLISYQGTGKIKNTELVPIILKNIDLGSSEVKCLSLEIFHNIVCTQDGLNYVTQTFDRFSAINQVFNSLCIFGFQSKSLSLVKWILSIYIRLCDKSHIRKSLCARGPDNVINAEMNKWLGCDESVYILYKKFKSILESG